MGVHQFLPSLSRGDAIGHHVQRIRPILERFGPSRIYVDTCEASLRKVALPYRAYEPSPGDVAVYHSSIGSPMARWLLGVPVPVIVDYHNVTPVLYFAAYEPRIAALLYAGRIECALLAGRSPLGIADSAYSAREMEGMGYPSAATVPIFLDHAAYERPPDRRLLDRLLATKTGTDVLYVGRLAPNKRQEDVMKAFALYRRHFDPGARLFLVGRASSPRYARALEEFAAELGVGGIHMVGGVSDEQLFAHYRAADAYLSMSEHEGFCVPLVECMIFGVPVVAYAAAAVPETLGEAGVLVRHRRYEEIAALVHLVATDAGARGRLVAAGRARLELFRPEQHEPRLAGLVSAVLDG